MNRKEILDVISGVIPQTKIEGDQLKKRTIADTFHVGGLSGNRLNSGTLRSQFIICEKESDWENSDMSAKKAIHCDQRVFVQKAENDIWDVYVGKTQDSETEEPLLLKQNQSNLKDLLNQERKNLLFEIKQTFARHTETESLQIIYYGAPGTGKSHIVKIHTEGESVVRTTFHPDSDYSTFVGCYKPTTKEIEMRDVTGKVIIEHDQPVTENRIIYQFVDQAFLQAYIKAWKFYAEAEEGVAPNKQFLIIEEINRGNCAQVFGDLFQLLDRDKTTGKSEYPIKANKDLVAHIEKVLGAGHEGIKNGELCLPPNLIIYATMNTSDQSLFPMDSAFKRRWDWEYVPINYSKDIDSGKFIIEIDEDTKYSWVEFLESVNDKIYDATNSEDKQMGNFFIKKSVKANEFVNKVMFYLWNEVCKEEYGTQRNFFRKGKEGKTEFKFTELFGDNQATILKEFMTSLGVEPIGKKPEEPAAE